jgi:hypothetical protein
LRIAVNIKVEKEKTGTRAYPGNLASGLTFPIDCQYELQHGDDKHGAQISSDQSVMRK